MLIRRLLAVASLAAVCSSICLGAMERSYVAGNYLLTLDGANCGMVKSVEGGAISAEVIQEPTGSDYYIKKHVGQPRYEDITINLGGSVTPANRPIFDWIAASWRANSPRKNGSIVVTDYQLKPKSQREFVNALITSTTIPAADGSSKEPAYIGVTLSPELIRDTQPSETKAGGPSSKTEQRALQPANFTLQIDGINTTRVSKVSELTIRQQTISQNIGNARDYEKQPGKLEFPNLQITVPTADAQDFINWHKSFVIEGQNGQNQEKSGSLTFLTPDRKQGLLTVKFFNMGIFRIAPEKAESGADGIERTTVELYVERMELELPSAAKQ